MRACLAAAFELFDDIVIHRLGAQNLEEIQWLRRMSLEILKQPY